MNCNLENVVSGICDGVKDYFFDKYGLFPSDYSYGALAFFVLEVLISISEWIHSEEFIDDVFYMCCSELDINEGSIPPEFIEDFYEFIDRRFGVEHV